MLVGASLVLAAAARIAVAGNGAIDIDGTEVYPTSGLATEQQGFKALNHMMDNVDVMQAKTAGALDSMQKDTFFAVPKKDFIDPGPTTVTQKKVPSSFLEEPTKKKTAATMTELEKKAQANMDKFAEERKKLEAEDASRKAEAQKEDAKLEAGLDARNAQMKELFDHRHVEAKPWTSDMEGEPDDSSSPSSLLQTANGQYLTIDGMRLTPTSSLQQEEAGFKALDHVMDNVNKMQVSTAKRIAEMKKDSFFQPLKKTPSSLIEEADIHIHHAAPQLHVEAMDPVMFEGQPLTQAVVDQLKATQKAAEAKDAAAKEQLSDDEEELKSTLEKPGPDVASMERRIQHTIEETENIGKDQNLRADD